MMKKYQSMSLKIANERFFGKICFILLLLSFKSIKAATRESFFRENRDNPLNNAGIIQRAMSTNVD